MIDVEVLERFPIFSGLAQQLLEDIARLCSARSYDSQAIIFTEGDKAEKFYLLQSGKVSIERKLSQSWLRAEGISDVVISNEQAGAAFAWSALVEPGILTASARCRERCEVIEIDGKGLLDILDKSPAVSYLFMKRLASIIALRLAETAERLFQQTAEVETYKSM
ncbi:MAG: cyclic nucleotide-binding domain-containing protein [Dehalococcoidia bacterium]